MAKTYSLTLVLCVCAFFHRVHAQDNIPDFGKIDMADMQLKECPFDKEADAMYLLNYRDLEVYTTNYGTFVNIEERVRIKILRATGTKYAAIEIPYFKDAEKVKNIAANSYNLDEHNNIVTKSISRDDIFKQAMDNTKKSFRFAFPDVRPGTIIEYRFFEKREFSAYIEPWLFEKDIPVKESFYKVTYKKSIDHSEKIVATQPLIQTTDSTAGDHVVKTFIMANIPAYRYEPFSNSIKDNIQYAQFSFMPGLYFDENKPVGEKWDELMYHLTQSAYFGYQFNMDIPGAKNKIDSIVKLPAWEHIPAILNLVRNNIQWDDTYSLLSENVNDTWTSRKGSSGDINLLLLNLLKKAGVKCSPVLASTRDNGRIDTQYCSYSQFNCVDVGVFCNDSLYILDATQKYQPYTIMPYNLVNGYAMIGLGYQHHWLTITDGNKPLMRNVINVKVDIDSSGIAYGSTSQYFYGYAKVTVLSGDGNNESSRDMLQTDITSIKIDSIVDKNKDDDDKPLIRSFNFKAEMQQTGDYLFLNPLFLSSFRKNPFVDSVRRADIDFGCNQSYNINMYITLPDNIEVSDLPSNKEIRLADTSFSYGRFAAKQNNAVVLRTHLDLQNASYAASQYPFVREIFNKIYAMFNEQLVFKYKK